MPDNDPLQQGPYTLLPAFASEASRIRYDVARELVQLCPPAFGFSVAALSNQSSALAGKGLKDRRSDLA